MNGSALPHCPGFRAFVNIPVPWVHSAHREPTFDQRAWREARGADLAARTGALCVLVALGSGHDWRRAGIRDKTTMSRRADLPLSSSYPSLCTARKNALFVLL